MHMSPSAFPRLPLAPSWRTAHPALLTLGVLVLLALTALVGPPSAHAAQRSVNGPATLVIGSGKASVTIANTRAGNVMLAKLRKNLSTLSCAAHTREATTTGAPLIQIFGRQTMPRRLVFGRTSRRASVVMPGAYHRCTLKLKATRTAKVVEVDFPRSNEVGVMLPGAPMLGTTKANVVMAEGYMFAAGFLLVFPASLIDGDNLDNWTAQQWADLWTKMAEPDLEEPEDSPTPKDDPFCDGTRFSTSVVMTSKNMNLETCQLGFFKDASGSIIFAWKGAEAGAIQGYIRFPTVESPAS